MALNLETNLALNLETNLETNLGYHLGYQTGKALLGRDLERRWALQHWARLGNCLG